MLAQRLVRVLCPVCKTASAPDAALTAQLGLSPDARFFQAGGCDFCRTEYSRTVDGSSYRSWLNVGLYPTISVSDSAVR